MPDPETIRGRCDAIRRRVDKTTPGPWRDRKSVHGNQYRYVQIGKEADYTTLEMMPADARFIANARDDVLELLDYIATLAPRAASTGEVERPDNGPELWCRQHIAWIKMYADTMTSENWRDQQLYILKQISELQEDFKAALAQVGTRAAEPVYRDIIESQQRDLIEALRDYAAEHDNDITAEAASAIECLLKLWAAQVSTRDVVEECAKICRLQSDKWSKRATELAHRGGEAVAQARADMAGELEDDIRVVATENDNE